MKPGDGATAAPMIGVKAAGGVSVSGGIGIVKPFANDWSQGATSGSAVAVALAAGAPGGITRG